MIRGDKKCILSFPFPAYSFLNVSLSLLHWWSIPESGIMRAPFIFQRDFSPNACSCFFFPSLPPDEQIYRSFHRLIASGYLRVRCRYHNLVFRLFRSTYEVGMGIMRRLGWENFFRTMHNVHRNYRVPLSHLANPSTPPPPTLLYIIQPTTSLLRENSIFHSSSKSTQISLLPFFVKVNTDLPSSILHQSQYWSPFFHSS